jgi:hypothetical protein
MERKVLQGAALVSLLALAGLAPSVEAGGREPRTGLRMAAEPRSGTHTAGFSMGPWSWLVRLAGTNRGTIDPNGQTIAGDGTNNHGTIDPDGQPAAGASPDSHITIDPNA